MVRRNARALCAALAVLSAGFLCHKAFPRDITIAQVAAFSGAQAPSGKAIRAGIKLYFDHVNRTGGVGGDRIRFITRDDHHKCDETVKLVQELIDRESPVAFIAALGTANVEALIKDGVLTRANIPLVGAISGASTMIGAPNVFVTKASYRDEVRELFELVTRSGVKRLAIFYQDDSLGRDILQSVEAAAPALGINIAARARYERNATNVDDAVIQVLKADPQFVYLAAVTTAATEFIKQYRAKGGGAQLYGLSVIDPANLLKTLGPDLARGYAFGVPSPLSTARKFAIVREYHELKNNSDDADLTERSIEKFIAAKALVHALRQSKTPSPAATLKAVANMKSVDLGDYWIDFSRFGQTGSQFDEFAIIGAKGRIDH
jgi:branched-chain amino acid transport system substrate-binding protein